MRKFLLIPLALLLAISLVAIGCPAEEAPSPAFFRVSNLTITPPEAETGEAVDISVTVFNTGDSSGSYSLVLKINDASVEEKSVTVAARAGQRFSFSVTKDEGGSYNVDVNGLTGSFTVVAPPPPPPPPPEGEEPPPEGEEPPPAGASYTWEEAKDHKGETATVTGPIIDTMFYGDQVLLGMGVSIYDSATVGIVLNAADIDKYPEDLYVGRTIAVTGTLINNPYGGANIEVSDPSQIVEQ